jgi:hypothetical protein
MAKGWPKGQPRPQGAGRKKGTPNKLTVSVRQAFKDAFDYLQRDINSPAHLRNWGEANPKEFYSIAQKLIPQEISGPEGADIPVTINVKLVKPDGG